MRNQNLQRGHQKLLSRYATFSSHMLTLTMKDGISSSKAHSSIDYFIQQLNWEMYGRKTQKSKTRSKCRIIAIPAIEGLMGQKRIHAHIVIGNIPTDRHQSLERSIREAWSSTKCSMDRMRLDPLHDAEGAAFYLCKEVGFINDDAIGWEIASIPSVLYAPRKLQSVEEARRLLNVQATKI